MHRTISLALLLTLTAGSAFAQAPARPPIPPQPPGAPPTPGAPPPGQQAGQGQSGTPSGGQSAMPHAWLFGSWTGGFFPAPVTLSAQECLANPSVIFTRDVILRAVPTDVTYSQIVVESARAIPGGAEFRLTVPPQAASTAGAFGIGASSPAQTVGFGCENPAVLRVQRRGEDQIAFPSCSDFPYPLVRCPAH